MKFLPQSLLTLTESRYEIFFKSWLCKVKNSSSKALYGSVSPEWGDRNSKRIQDWVEDVEEGEKTQREEREHDRPSRPDSRDSRVSRGSKGLFEINFVLFSSIILYLQDQEHQRIEN